MNTSPHGLNQTFNSRKNIYLFILLLSLLQLAFVHAYIPVGEWFSRDAIYTDDFSFHYGHVLEKITYLKEFGKMWGYNPLIRAGSIANANTTIDNNGCVLFSFFLFFLPVEVSFKLYFILGIVIVPLLCYKTARNFDLSQNVSLLVLPDRNTFDACYCYGEFHLLGNSFLCLFLLYLHPNGLMLLPLLFKRQVTVSHLFCPSLDSGRMDTRFFSSHTIRTPSLLLYPFFSPHEVVSSRKYFCSTFLYYTSQSALGISVPSVSGSYRKRHDVSLLRDTLSSGTFKDVPLEKEPF